MEQADGAYIDTSATDCDREATLYRFLRAFRRMHERVEHEFQQVGLSGAKFDVLQQLSRASEPLPLRMLAEAQRCVPSNITTLVDRLESDGLVRRIDDPSDRRMRRAQLTLAGEARFAEGLQVIEQMNRRFDDVVASSGFTMLDELLESIDRF